MHWTLRTMLGSRRRDATARPATKLATYLGARNYHRFSTRDKAPGDAGRNRRRLIICALLLLLIGLWGVWGEFNGL